MLVWIDKKHLTKKNKNQPKILTNKLNKTMINNDIQNTKIGLDDILKGKWKQIKGEIQKQWGNLTGDDLDQVAGDRMKLLGLLQEKYGLSKKDAEMKIESIINRYS